LGFYVNFGANTNTYIEQKFLFMPSEERSEKESGSSQVRDTKTTNFSTSQPFAKINNISIQNKPKKKEFACKENKINYIFSKDNCRKISLFESNLFSLCFNYYKVR